MEIITKKARVVAIDKNCLHVEIITCSACGDCVIKSSCNLHDSRKKVIKVSTDQAASYHLGDEIEISLKAEQGVYAAVLAFGIPLLLLIGVIFGGFYFELSDTQSCICGIIILIPYYFALSLSRHIWDHKFCCSLKNYQSKD